MTKQKRKPCFHCGGKLIPINDSDIINDIIIQIYKCIDCGNETKIPEEPPLQTSLEDSEPTLLESYNHPNA